LDSNPGADLALGILTHIADGVNRQVRRARSSSHQGRARRSRRTRSSQIVQSGISSDTCQGTGRHLAVVLASAGNGLNVHGRLSAAGKAIPLEVETTLRRDGDDLVLDATAVADHRQLGMTWGARLGLRSPSRVIVHACLTREAAAVSR
jgi:hypothetical protein